MAMATLHYAYDSWHQLNQPPPNAAANIWDDYVKMIENVPAKRRHQRIHAGHNCWVLPEEEKFLTPELIGASCLVGTLDQVAEQLHQYKEAGLDEIMMLPAFDPRYEVIERVGKELLPVLEKA